MILDDSPSARIGVQNSYDDLRLESVGPARVAQVVPGRRHHQGVALEGGEVLGDVAGREDEKRGVHDRESVVPGVVRVEMVLPHDLEPTKRW